MKFFFPRLVRFFSCNIFFLLNDNANSRVSLCVLWLSRIVDNVVNVNSWWIGRVYACGTFMRVVRNIPSSNLAVKRLLYRKCESSGWVSRPVYILFAEACSIYAVIHSMKSVWEFYVNVSVAQTQTQHIHTNTSNATHKMEIFFSLFALCSSFSVSDHIQRTVCITFFDSINESLTSSCSSSFFSILFGVCLYYFISLFFRGDSYTIPTILTFIQIPRHCKHTTATTTNETEKIKIHSQFTHRQPIPSFVYV